VNSPDSTPDPEKFAWLRHAHRGLKLPETILTDYQHKRIGQSSQKRQALYTKGLLNRVSSMTAIKLMCLQCVCEDVKAIAECGDICCPLWHFRPFQPKAPREAAGPPSPTQASG
jgi:hypothetical protein